MSLRPFVVLFSLYYHPLLPLAGSNDKPQGGIQIKTKWVTSNHLAVECTRTGVPHGWESNKRQNIAFSVRCCFTLFYALSNATGCCTERSIKVEGSPDIRSWVGCLSPHCIVGGWQVSSIIPVEMHFWWERRIKAIGKDTFLVSPCWNRCAKRILLGGRKDTDTECGWKFSVRISLNVVYGALRWLALVYVNRVAFCRRW